MLWHAFEWYIHCAMHCGTSKKCVKIPSSLNDVYKTRISKYSRNWMAWKCFKTASTSAFVFEHSKGQKSSNGCVTIIADSTKNSWMNCYKFKKHMIVAMFDMRACMHLLLYQITVTHISNRSILQSGCIKGTSNSADLYETKSGHVFQVIR